MPRDYQRYNSGMGGVDFFNQQTAAYKLDRKSSVGRYFLRLFFDLIDSSVVNSHAIWKVLSPKEIELLDFKIVLAKLLIGTYDSWNTLVSHVFFREVLPGSVLIHLPVCQAKRGKCRYCFTGGIGNKTYIQRNTCGVFLCLISGNRSRNCFANFYNKY